MSIRVLGSINVDTICLVDRLPGPGETVSARETLMLPGGKGANQAIAAARLGAAVRMTGCVGDDDGGRFMLAALREAGVAVSDVTTHRSLPTGAAYIAVDPAAENMIVVAPGANAEPPSSPADDAAAIVLAQLEMPVAAIAALFAAATARGAITILNAAPAIAGAEILFAGTDILIVNESELARYAGAGDPLAAARRLRQRPGQTVVVTLGAAGALEVGAETTQVPGYRVEAVDTVGAGDCFCGALAVALDAGESMAGALAFANAAAALATTRRGAASSMPGLADVRAVLARR